jgi:hypothetical protein
MSNVEVKILINGREAAAVTTGPDGSFSAEVQVSEGTNNITCETYGSEGKLLASETQSVEYVAEAEVAEEGITGLVLIAVIVCVVAGIGGYFAEKKFLKPPARKKTREITVPAKAPVAPPRPTPAAILLESVPPKVTSPEISVKGRVEDDLGNPVPNAQVKILVNGKETAEVTTSLDGSFSAVVPVTKGANNISCETYGAEGDLLASGGLIVEHVAEGVTGRKEGDEA